MFKKAEKLLSFIITVLLVTGLATSPLYAMSNDPTMLEPRWTNATRVVLSMGLNSDKISLSVTIAGHSGTTYSNGKVTLEKLVGSSYVEVESWSGLSSSSAIFLFGDSSVKKVSGTTYRLRVSIKATRNGVSETITESREVTC